jgi:hypothetical protein
MSQHLYVREEFKEIFIGGKKITVDGNTLQVDDDIANKEFIESQVPSTPFTSGILTVTENTIGISNNNPDLFSANFYLTINSGNKYMKFNDSSIVCSNSFNVTSLGNMVLNTSNELHIIATAVVLEDLTTISNVDDPVYPNDCANKNYVDLSIQTSTIRVYSRIVTLNSIDINSLQSNPFILVAGTPGTTIVLESLEFYLNFGSTQYTINTDQLDVKYRNSNDVIVTPTGLISSNTSKRIFVKTNSVFTLPLTTGIDLVLQSNYAISNGDSPLKIKITYQEISLLQ